MRTETILSLRIIFFIFFIFFFTNDQISAQIITTVAGNGIAGYSGDNGKGINASMNNPTGMAFDHAGHLLITDQLNNVIRQLDTATGVITTIAGQGIAGHTGDGGLATKARLDGPTGIAVDAQGNIYIAEEFSFIIRKISTSGIISTIAGIPYNAGYSGDGSPAVNATLSYPTGVAIDPAGNVFVADYNNSVIRKIDISSKNISTIAGGGSSAAGSGIPALNSSFFNPPRICFDNSGDLIIADEFFCLIKKVTMSTGIINTVAGFTQQGYTGDGGLATYALLNHPTGMVVNAAGDLFIADCDNNVVRVINGATGIINTIAGNGTQGYSGDGGDALKASVNHPTDLLVAANGDLYIADAHNNVIRKLSRCRVMSARSGSPKLCQGTNLALSETNTNGSWSSSNSTIVSVNQQGIVKAIKEGNATISYTYDNGTCTIIDTTFITVPPAPFLFLGNDTNICKSLPLILDAGSNFINYAWSTGARNETITVNAAGTFSVRATDKNQCIANDTIVVLQAFNGPVINWPTASAICDGTPIILNTPTDLKYIQWQDSSSDASFVVKRPGTYWVNIIDTHGCRGTDTLKIEKTIFAPVKFLTKDTSICSFETIVLNSSLPFSSYLWSTGGASPSITINNPGIYSLEVHDFNNCIWKENVTVNQKRCALGIFFPSAFTPNNDGLNDLFRPTVYGRIDFFKIAIYNKWGRKLFETDNWQNGWDGLFSGAMQPVGPYVWISTYKLAGSEKINTKGIVTLLR